MLILEFLLTPLISMLLLSMLVSFIIVLANRLLINREQLNAWRREIAEWTSEFNKARRASDKRLLAKLQKQQPRIMQLQSKVFFQSLKVWPVSLATVIIVWYVLIPRIPNIQTSFAIIPGLFGANISIPMFWWYMICSFMFGALFSYAFGVGMEAPE